MRAATADLVLYARFTPTPYTLRVNSTGGGRAEGGGRYNYGSEVTVRAYPNEGFVFDGWSYTGSANSSIQSTTSSTTTVVVNGNTTVTANFRIKTYTVKLINYDGTVIASYNVDHGTSIPTPGAPSRSGYTFIGWSEDFSCITRNIVAVAQYVENTVKHKVTFVNWDGTVLKTEDVYEGAYATAPEAPTRENGVQYSYEFAGWDTRFDRVTEDITVTAVYSLVLTKHLITYMNYNGSVIYTEYVEFGKRAPGPDFTPERPNWNGYKYVFAGWDQSVSYITRPVKTYALYKEVPIQSTVTFVGYNGEVLKEEVVAFEQDATAPEAPQVVGYEFTGWDADFTNVTEDITVTAQYTKVAEVYTVEFFSYGGQILKSEKVAHGSSATPPEPPVEFGYEFTGWGGMSYTNVTSYRGVLAQYKPLDGYVNLYVIKKGAGKVDSEIVSVNSVATGEGVYTDSSSASEGTYTEDTTIKLTAVAGEGHKFAGWEYISGEYPTDLSSATTNITLTQTTHVRAVFEQNYYTVNFVDWNGTAISTQKVVHGGSAVPPTTNPSREGYDFAGWDKSITNITGDTTITATYISGVEMVSLIVNENNYGFTTGAGSYEVGTEVKVSAVPAEGYRFVRWNVVSGDTPADTTKITTTIVLTQDTVIAPVYEIVKCNLTLEASTGGTVTGSGTYNFGEYASIIATPKQGYKFVRWTVVSGNIPTNDWSVGTTVMLTEDETVLRAEFEPMTCTLTLETDQEGAVLTGGGVYDYGSMVTIKAEPPEGYAFDIWHSAKNGTITNYTSSETTFRIEGNASVQARFIRKTYVVTFVDTDGMILKTQTVKYGDAATAPTVIDRNGQKFVAWDTDFSFVKSNLTVKAIREKCVYTVTFKDWDGTVLDVQKVEYGSPALTPEIPTRENYTFAGWDKSYTYITGDTTITARYSGENYIVTFVDEDGTVLKTETVAHGEAATAPEVPSKEGYDFYRWDKTFTSVTYDMVITAKYLVKKFTVTFEDFDGTEIKTETVEYGKSATAPEAPAREGYGFAGWDKTFDNVTENLVVKALYEKTSATLTITDVSNGTATGADTYAIGAEVTISATPAANYRFVRWNVTSGDTPADITSSTTTITLTQDTVIKPVYCVDGKWLLELEVSDGGTVSGAGTYSDNSGVTIRATAKTGYKFVRWVAVSGNTPNSLTSASSTVTINRDTVIRAEFEPVSYTLTLTSSPNVATLEGGGVYAYGTVVPIKAVVPEGYTFSRWTVSGSCQLSSTTSAETKVTITGNATVTAVLTAKTYTVRFVDFDGTSLKVQTVAHGATPTAPTMYDKNGYAFVGWDTDFSNVTSNLTVTAIREKALFKVTFINYDGSVLLIQNVKRGQSATPSVTPARPSTKQYTYTFAGWDTDFSSVTEDIIVTAVFNQAIRTYTVEFKNYDGSVLSTQLVEYGAAATAPENPKRGGYSFAGWDADFSLITANTTVNAVYIKTGYLKVEISGGTGFTISIDGGKARPQGPSYTNSKVPVGAEVTVVANAIADTEFLGWQNSVTGAVVSKDLEYTFLASGNDSIKAMFKVEIEGVKLVSFYNTKSGEFGRLLDSQYYAADDEIIAPDDPTQIGFDFTEWDMDTDEIRNAIAAGEDVNVNAEWERQIILVNVTVNGGSGTGKYNANAAVTAVANEAAEGEKFAYWTDAQGNIKSYSTEYKFYPSADTEVTAVFVPEDAEVEEMVLVSIDCIDTTSIANKNTFIYSWECPDTYEFVKAGILAVNKDNYNEETFMVGTSDSNVYDRSPSGTNNKPVNTYVWTKSNVASGQVWVAMAYVQYRNEQGILVTVYSEMVEAAKE